MPQNNDPFAPWNDPMHNNDPFAPHNDPMYRDDPFKPWNDPIGRKEDLSDQEASRYGIHRERSNRYEEDNW